MQHDRILGELAGYAQAARFPTFCMDSFDCNAFSAAGSAGYALGFKTEPLGTP